MASLLAWVDYSSAHREEMDRLLDAFRDEGTVDEFGVGTVRNTFSELLFPGTSTLHTRARYLLFVPWAVTTVTARRLPADRAVREIRQQEVRLIEALRSGDIDGGVIGRDAPANLGRTASVVYWGALAVYGIKRCGHTIEQHLRFSTERPLASVDEDDDVQQLRHVDPCFRQLPPSSDDWLRTSDFALTWDEAEFLRDRILGTCADRYLGWLVQAGVPRMSHGTPAWSRTCPPAQPVHSPMHAGSASCTKAPPSSTTSCSPGTRAGRKAWRSTPTSSGSGRRRRRRERLPRRGTATISGDAGRRRGGG